MTVDLTKISHADLRLQIQALHSEASALMDRADRMAEDAGLCVRTDHDGQAAACDASGLPLFASDYVLWGDDGRAFLAEACDVAPPAGFGDDDDEDGQP